MMPLAAGGMARIYIGRTTGIGSFERHVVLKLITPERANDHTAVQMFLDEARLAASLNHQNVAQVFEVGEDGGIHYLAMEYVHGQDLRALLAKAGSQGTRVPLELALTTVAGAAAGLNHAHERRGPDGVPLGIVHRDVSPSNIMVGYDGSVKLLDFGIAKATQRSIETQSGIIKGKFAYMAPEQCRGRDVDRRSDVFSLGIILYEITTQHRCFRADSDFDTMHRIVTGDVVRPTRLIQGYPQALEAIVMKALAVDPNQRYQSAGALNEAIESFAVASRMSLSTMSLGRFMRDMFGDLTEPWLRAGRDSQQPLQPRESTISNTNGTHSEAAQRAPTPLPIDAAMAAHTVLELPREGAEDESVPEPNAAEWNATSYPTAQPAYAAPQTLAPEPTSGPVGRTSSPMLPVAQHTPSSGHPAYPYPPQMQMQPQALPTPPHGSQPLPMPPPPGQFSQGPGSGSGPAHGIPATRHGYTSGAQTRADISYPRYEPPPGSVDDDSDLRLQPNRRPLLIGVGIAAIGLIILLAMKLGGGDDESKDEGIVMKPGSTEPDSEDPGSAGSARAVAATPDAVPEPKVESTPESKTEPKTLRGPTPNNTVTAGSNDAPPVIEDQSITLDVRTEPKGADVILAGKVIGTTPLKTKHPRSNGMSMITVHKARYVDVTTQIDLSDDFTSDLKLKLVEEPKPATPKTPKTTTPKTPTPTPKKTCQPPEQYNPLDSRPVCK